jgi:hypothetical protein
MKVDFAFELIAQISNSFTFQFYYLQVLHSLKYEYLPQDEQKLIAGIRYQIKNKKTVKK